MSYLVKRGGEWWTCGCGGTPKSVFNVPEGVTEIIPVGALTTQTRVGPVTGISYNFTPHRILVDVDSADAVAFVNSGKARFVTNNDLSMNGAGARRGDQKVQQVA